MFKWLWGEHKKKTPIEFTSEPLKNNSTERHVRVHLDLALDVSNNVDLVNSIMTMKMNFHMPEGTCMKNLHLSHIEILN
jgi:hypothetical protein